MEKDLVDYAYLSDNLRYADLFNGALFGGKEVIAARELSEKESKVVSGKKLRSRDLVRKYGKNMNLAVLGVDNPAYKNLDMDAYDVMMVHSHSKELEELRDYAEREDGDMCKALQDWAAEEREIGMKLQLYKMISRGKLTIKEALSELDGARSEEELIADMREAGFPLP